MSTAIEFWTRGQDDPVTLVVNAEISQIQEVLASALKIGNAASVAVLVQKEWPSSYFVHEQSRGEGYIIVDFIAFRVSRSTHWRSMSFHRFIKKFAS